MTDRKAVPHFVDERGQIIGSLIDKIIRGDDVRVLEGEYKGYQGHVWHKGKGDFDQHDLKEGFIDRLPTDDDWHVTLIKDAEGNGLVPVKGILTTEDNLEVVRGGVMRRELEAKAAGWHVWHKTNLARGAERKIENKQVYKPSERITVKHELPDCLDPIGSEEMNQWLEIVLVQDADGRWWMESATHRMRNKWNISY